MGSALISRPVFLAEKVLLLDGLTGTGKTMMAPLLGSFARVELGKFNYLYEYLCALDFLKRIEPDAAKSLVRMYTDLDLYNLSISREVNLRPKDLSGIFQNPHPFRYLRRLFVKDGAAAEVRIKQDKPILHLISHQALPIMGLLFRALGDKLRVVELVRHPYYLIEHWYSYIDRHGTDPRDFTIWIDWKGRALPWFAYGWEDQYLAATSIDRVIYVIEWLTRKGEEAVASFGARSSQILFIPFENFVLNPYPYLQKIENLLDTKITPVTKRILRAQKCPRSQVAAGPAKEIYKRYRWQKPDRGASEAEELEKKRAFAKEQASPEAFNILDRLAQEYESRYGRWF